MQTRAFTMHLGCDVILRTADARVYEWVLFIRSASYTEAVPFAEEAVTARWQGMATIDELFVSLDTGSLEKQAAGNDDESGLYATREPQEFVKHVPLLRRLIERLFGGRG